MFFNGGLLSKNRNRDVTVENCWKEIPFAFKIMLFGGLLSAFLALFLPFGPFLINWPILVI